LGASPRRLLAQVLRGSLVIAVPAAVVGTLLAWMLDGVLAGAIQGRADIGPLLALGTASILLACALVATILPARKAMRIQPLAVLKGS
jgi:putative ABC transport system permease protein